MARPSNLEILGRYQQKIKASKQWRRDEDYDDTWERLIRLYRGKHYEYLTDEDRLLVNISFSTINVIAPSVAVNYPKIAVNATKPEDAPKAMITEAVINYWWRHFKVRPEFRRAVKDFLVVGHGWLKCGYRYVEEERIEESDEYSDPAIDGNDVTPTIVITEDRPFVERVSPFDVFVDPDATSMSDISWIAQRIRRSIKEVKADKRYSPKAREWLQATSWKKRSVGGAEKDLYDTAEGYVEVWEFYDLKKKTLSVFADGCEHFLVSPRPMPYPFGHPFVMIRNYDVPDEFYPIGDLEAIEPLQRELNETRTQMMNHRKRYARKYLYKEAAFDSDGRAALESDYDNVMVPVKGDEPIGNVVAPMPSTITPPEFYNQSQLISEDVMMVSGVSEYMRGSLPEIRRTATEAAIVQDASNARAADKLAIIEQAIAEVASKMVQLAQTFMTGEQVARIVGKDGNPLWVTFDKDYIAGEFDYEIEAGSTAPANESFRRQMALQMVDALAPFVQMGVINPAALARHVLQFGFGVKQPEEFLQEAPQPQMGGAPPPEAMPPGGMPPDMGMGMGMEMGAIAPPAATSELSGIDPAVLAQLSSLVGLDTNTM